PAGRVGLRPLRLRPHHHRRWWDLAAGRGARDGEYLVDATCPLLLQTSVKLYGIGGHVVLLWTFVFEGWARSGSSPSASAQYISASFRYWRLCRSDFATAARLVEEHDIVYREALGSSEVAPQSPAAPTGAVWRRAIHADEVMLFRYSALIFVGHRIHYDRRYATEVEGYPGLVVHGPLIATLLADVLRRHSSAPPRSLRFRAISPLFDNAPFAVCGMPEPDGRASLWAQNAEGALAMKADAVMHSA